MSEAGRSDAGRTLQVAFLAADFMEDDEVVAWLATQLRDALGLDVAVVYIPLFELLDRIGKGAYDLYYLAWGADYVDADSMLRGPNWEENCAWSNEAFATIVEKARTEPDRVKRLAMYGQAERIVIEEAPLIPLYYRRIRQLVKPWVRRLAKSSTGQTLYKDVVVER
jgi:oligopeptide transport system substrate-binding protein